MQLNWHVHVDARWLCSVRQAFKYRIEVSSAFGLYLLCTECGIRTQWQLQHSLVTLQSWAGLEERLKALAAKRNLGDLSVGPVLTWTNERMKAHIDRLLQIPGAPLPGHWHRGSTGQRCLYSHGCCGCACTAENAAWDFQSTDRAVRCSCQVRQHWVIYVG